MADQQGMQHIGGEDCRIGIISDTHDNVANIKKAVLLFKKNRISRIIHLGDIVAPATVPFFRGLKLMFITGNCDGDVYHIQEQAKKIHAVFLGAVSELELCKKRLLLVHNPEFLLSAAVQSGRFDYILHGHTHKKRDELRGATRIINPGAHYFGCENTIAIIDVSTGKLQFIRL